MSDWMNSEQREHVEALNNMKRSDLCPCGWYSENECLMHCSTGARTDAARLAWRIKEIYKQIDNTRATPTLSAAMQLPEVRALVEAATPYVSPVQLGDYAGQLRRHEALVAALAAFTEVKP